jgi:hypothetical protein
MKKSNKFWALCALKLEKNKNDEKKDKSIAEIVEIVLL